MAITAAQVKELRERTGAGMMDCKSALTEAEGDFDKAVEILAKKSKGKADKASGRIAAQGMVVTALTADQKTGAIVEINCQTDFVARGDEFKNFANLVAAQALASGTSDVAALEQIVVEGKSLKEHAEELTAKSGEKHAIRRVARITSSGVVASYVHFGSQIAVLVAVEGEGSLASLADEVALQIASMKPLFVRRDEVDQEAISKQREIGFGQLANEETEAQAELDAWKVRMADEEKENPGQPHSEAVLARLNELEKRTKSLASRPQQAKDKIVDGKVNKWMTDVVLLDQPSVKEAKKSVAALIAAENKTAVVTSFARYEVGEGVVKAEAKDFATEVAEMAAAAAAKS